MGEQRWGEEEHTKNVQMRGDREKTINVEKGIEEGKMERNEFGRDKGDM